MSVTNNNTAAPGVLEVKGTSELVVRADLGRPLTSVKTRGFRRKRRRVVTDDAGGKPWLTADGEVGRPECCLQE